MHRINQSQVHLKKVGVGLGCIIFFAAIWEIATAEKIWQINNLVNFIPLIAAVILYLVGYFDRFVEYNKSHLYIKTRSKTRQIPLSAIRAIKLTNLTVNNTRYWTINYVTNTIETIHILPSSFNNNFGLFIHQVRAVNPVVDADHYENEEYWGLLRKTSWRRNES